MREVAGSAQKCAASVIPLIATGMRFFPQESYPTPGGHCPLPLPSTLDVHRARSQSSVFLRGLTGTS